MEPIPLKPQPNASIYVGQYNEKLLAFIPAPVAVFQETLNQRRPLQCADHVVGGKKIIAWGDEIVLVKWPIIGVKRGDGQRVYGAESFCSVTCQRHRAVL
jgi:hypothetical protein